MFKRIVIAGSAVVALLAVSGFMTSAASALPAPGCYLIDHFKAKEFGGNFKNRLCNEAAPVLEGEWESVTPVKETGVLLYCAVKLAEAKNSGSYTNNTCATQASAGENTEFFSVLAQLPTIHTALPGETYPLNLGGHLTGTSKLFEEGGGALEGKEFSVLLNVAELTSLGTAVVDFLGVEEPKEKTKCSTPGDSEANGAVLIPGAEFHLVYTNLEPLELGALTLFNKFIILCDAGTLEDITVGPSTTRVSVPAPTAGTEGDISFLNIASHCFNTTLASQEIPYYYNDKGEVVPTTLLANLSGTGLKKSCEEITGTTLIAPETGSLATMFTVLY